jgi:hypothetical protein
MNNHVVHLPPPDPSRGMPGEKREVAESCLEFLFAEMIEAIRAGGGKGDRYGAIVVMRP